MLSKSVQGSGIEIHYYIYSSMMNFSKSFDVT